MQKKLLLVWELVEIKKLHHRQDQNPSLLNQKKFHKELYDHTMVVEEMSLADGRIHDLKQNNYESWLIVPYLMDLYHGGYEFQKEVK